jgi:Xaa-Pro aminopeptidase
VTPPPFDTAKLDAEMEREGIDLIVATSRHNVRYLLGTYSDFFRHFDAIGVDRYLPAVGYPRERPEDAFLVAAEIDRQYFEVEVPWMDTLLLRSQTARETAALVAEQAQRLNSRAIGIEHSFAPATFTRELKGAHEAAPLLEELRAVKRPDELQLLREAAEGIVDAIAAVVDEAAPGLTTREITHRLRAQEQERGLGFEYCLIAAGDSFNRAPSGVRWELGGVLSIDSGGEREGYIGDLCRMAVMGEPTQQMVETLEQAPAPPAQRSTRRCRRSPSASTSSPTAWGSSPTRRRGSARRRRSATPPTIATARSRPGWCSRSRARRGSPGLAW